MDSQNIDPMKMVMRHVLHLFLPHLELLRSLVTSDLAKLFWGG